MKEKTIGVIGTGRIGNPMCKNLLRGGFRLHVFDVNKEAYQDLVEMGAQPESSAKDVAMKSDVIILSLFRLDTIEAVLQELCDDFIKGRVIIDTSTNLPELTRQYAARISEKGGSLLDAPITGGVAGSIAGTLSIMIGGEKEAFDSCKDVFETIGRDIVHIGSSGHGQISKAVNQSIMVGYFCVIAEAFGFANKAGADVGKIFSAIKNGGPKSEILNVIGNRYLNAANSTGKPDKAETMHYHQAYKKDLSYAIKEGMAIDAYMPIISQCMQTLQLTLSMGIGDDGGTGIYDLWKDCFNIHED